MLLLTNDADILRGGDFMKGLVGGVCLSLVVGCATAHSQFTDGTIKLGVMNDMSGLYAKLRWFAKKRRMRRAMCAREC